MKITIDGQLCNKNKTRYWLSKKIGISYNNLAKLCDNKTQSIRYEWIDKICEALDCNVEDILQIEKTTDN